VRWRREWLPRKSVPCGKTTAPKLTAAKHAIYVWLAVALAGLSLLWWPVRRWAVAGWMVGGVAAVVVVASRGAADCSADEMAGPHAMPCKACSV
jgi:hypothetical protein